MKILHIIDSLGLGGAQTIVKGIFEKQEKNKDIFLFALRKREINIKIDRSNVKIFNSRSKYSLAPIKELRSLIEKEKIEILHCHLFRSQFTGWLLKKRYFPKINLIFHEHGQIFQNNWYYNYFMRKAQKKVNLFIAVSKATKQELIQKANIHSKKIAVLYNFVDLDRFNRKKIKINVQKEREKLGIKKGEFVVGFAGRLVEMKGWKDFIEAAKILDSKNMKFLIAGDGKDRKELQTIIKDYEIGDKVFYLGYMSDMVLFYSLLDIFIIPSHWEPMGLTEIESQAMGVPVIATNVEGLNEIVNDKKDSLLFEAKNPKKMSLIISELYENKELRKKLIKNGLKNIQKYSLRDYLKKLVESYNEKI